MENPSFNFVSTGPYTLDGGANLPFGTAGVSPQNYFSASVGAATGEPSSLSCTTSWNGDGPMFLVVNGGTSPVSFYLNTIEIGSGSLNGQVVQL
jgi:hypothetical protein